MVTYYHLKTTNSTQYLNYDEIYNRKNPLATNYVARGFTYVPGRNRTCDPQLRRLLLYPLSY